MSKEESDKAGGPTAEQLGKAKAEAKAEGAKEGEATGRKAERDRVKAIVTHAEAQDRSEMAQHLAFETDMSVEQATALLAKSPKAAAAAGGLAAAMAGRTPAVTADAGNGDGSGTQEPTAIAPAADIYSSRAKATQAYARPK